MFLTIIFIIILASIIGLVSCIEYSVLGFFLTCALALTTMSLIISFITGDYSEDDFNVAPILLNVVLTISTVMLILLVFKVGIALPLTLFIAMFSAVQYTRFKVLLKGDS